MALRDHVHIVPRFGDVLVTIGLIKWKGWQFLRQTFFDRTIRLWAFIFALTGSLTGLVLELFAYPLRSIFRIKAGKLGAGFIITILALWNAALFNNEPTLQGYWNYISRSVYLVYTIIVHSDYSHLNVQELMNALWQPESYVMKIFFYVFAVSAFIKLMAMYLFGWRNENPWSKGESILYLSIKDYIKLGQSFFEVLYEPSMAVVLGWLCHSYLGDFRMALFLYISATALFLQEVTDYLVKMSYEK